MMLNPLIRRRCRRPLTVPLVAVALVGLASVPAVAGVEYTLTRIEGPPEATSVVPWGLNDLGVVVGWVVLPGEPLRAFFWTAGGGMTVLPAPPGEDASTAREISNNNIVAGGDEFGAGWTLQNGQYNVLPLIPGAASADTWGVNDVGDAAGTVNPSALLSYQSFFYDAVHDQMMPVAPWPSRAYDVNNDREVTGYAGTTAFRWTPEGGLQDLGPLNGTFSFTVGFAINEGGDVVGSASNQQSDNSSRAFIYTEESGMQMIPPVGLGNRAWGVNTLHVVVGDTDHTGFGDKGWVWSLADGLRLLDGLIDPAENASIITAHDINNFDQIVGLAFIGGDWAAYLLTPIGGGPSPGDLDGSGAVDVQDFLALLAAWGPCPDPPAMCLADLDHDGMVGVNDFLILLANWGSS
jgi:hypothetical protein